MSRTWQIVIAALLALVLITVACLAGYFLVRNLFPPESTLPPTTVPSEDESWQRVQAAGKLVVGTSADYPPFEYYVNDTQIDGFDIALMDEIGKRLGLEVEYRNFAFDGLAGALQVGQIDVAIAAISVTAEREASVDFTSVYLVGRDGILADEESGISTIRSVREMAGYTVGVQRGSVYETWLQTNLVDTAVMPADNLRSYERANEALRDLREGRLELVVLDLQPAQVAIDEGGVKLVGEGLNPQHYALALPKGANSLKAELDRAVRELHNDGVIAQLAKLYLNLDLDQLLPTPTPVATSTPGPAPDCVDGLALIAHPGQEGDPIANPPQMDAGQPFTKVWRVRNTGTCTWDGSYRLVFASGNRPGAQMGGKPVAVQGFVAPDQTYDIQVDLVNPEEPDVYVAFWQMENGAGQAFGERLPVAVEVVLAPPVPTQTPSPGIAFTVDRTQIEAGECVLFSWKVENVQAVYFYAEDQRWQDHGVPGEGRQQQCPSETTTYYLRVVKLDGSVEVQQITISVEGPADAPVIDRFEVVPSGQIELGECVDVGWSVLGSVDNVMITVGSLILWDEAPRTGSLQNCPSEIGTVAYRIQAVGPGGSAGQQQSIDVSEAVPTPEPTVTPDQPVIDYFRVGPEQISVGDCFDISWSTSGGATWVTVVKDEDALLDNAPLSGSIQDCPVEPGSVLYGVVAYNAQDQSVKEGQMVTVVEGAPGNPLVGTSWFVTSYYDPGVEGMVSVLPGTGLTAFFEDGGMLSGSAGCNTYQAAYSVTGTSLNIIGVGTTQLLCSEPEGVMGQERAFLSALQAAAGYSLEGGQLLIADASGRVLSDFVRRDR